MVDQGRAIVCLFKSCSLESREVNRTIHVVLVPRWVEVFVWAMPCKWSAFNAIR